MTAPVEKKLSPAMLQYKQFKQQHPGYVLFFRMGDFYEMFYEDAKIAHRVLGVTLTSRSKDGPEPVPMAGVPFHAVEGYLRRMIAAGHRVALCEQMEPAAQAKGVVKRDVTRLITPGTLTDESFLDGRSDNFLAAISFCLTKAGYKAGLAWAELSTGHVGGMSGSEAEMLEQIARLAPAEVLVPETAHGEPHVIAKAIEGKGVKLITARPGWQHTPDHAAEMLRKQYQAKTSEGFGFASDDPAMLSLGALLAYLGETQKTNLSHLHTPRRHTLEEHLGLDPATYRALEIDKTARSGGTEGSLLWAIDRTVTGMGARLLRQWVRFPLTDLEHISARQDAIATLIGSGPAQKTIRGSLERICDIERIVARVAVGRASPRDLGGLGKCLSLLPSLFDDLAAIDIKGVLAPEAKNLRLFCVEQGTLLSGALVDDPPPHCREGGLIRRGYDPELDRLSQISTNSQQYLAEYQAKLAGESGIPSLKVGYNRVFGYFIEVTESHREKVPTAWSRKQTVKNAERYITQELKNFEVEALGARDRGIALEQELFEHLRQKLLPMIGPFQELAGVIARLDVLCGLASLAVERRYVRPTVTAERVLDITDGKHPVLEQQLGSSFVSNDTTFTADHTLMLITGPNMAGKSTFIRQTALIVLLAQIGSFVPAASATVGLCDRIFARIGANDEIHSGQSTFMVEMTETANILNNATARSLVILDEIGRGTSTLDGLSLAWAIAEHLTARVKAMSLFATHYHELTQLAERDAGVRNFNVAVREWEDQVVFLHRIVEGGTDRSYGIHVARLAGVPKGVLERASELLGQLSVSHGPVAAMPVKARQDLQQMMLFAYEPSGLAKALSSTNPDELTPRDAVELIRQWKREFEKA